MNAYDIYDEKEPYTILYYAIARSEEEVKQMAIEERIDLEGLTIEIVRTSVKDQLGRDYGPSINDALVY